MKKDALISEDGKYRYSLTREWDPYKPKVLFVGLNPSTADQSLDDPTVGKCVRFAKHWGFGGLLIGNLFAIRSSSPEAIYTEEDPVGIENDKHLLKMASQAELVVACWGNHGMFKDRALEVCNLIPHMKCLIKNKTGQPRHPLYIRLSQELMEFN